MPSSNRSTRSYSDILKSPSPSPPSPPSRPTPLLLPPPRPSLPDPRPHRGHYDRNLDSPPLEMEYHEAEFDAEITRGLEDLHTRSPTTVLNSTNESANNSLNVEDERPKPQPRENQGGFIKASRRRKESGQRRDHYGSQYHYSPRDEERRSQPRHNSQPLNRGRGRSRSSSRGRSSSGGRQRSVDNVDCSYGHPVPRRHRNGTPYPSSEAHNRIRIHDRLSKASDRREPTPRPQQLHRGLMMMTRNGQSDYNRPPRLTSTQTPWHDVSTDTCQSMVRNVLVQLTFLRPQESQYF